MMAKGSFADENLWLNKWENLNFLSRSAHPPAGQFSLLIYFNFNGSQFIMHHGVISINFPSIGDLLEIRIHKFHLQRNLHTRNPEESSFNHCLVITSSISISHFILPHFRYVSVYLILQNILCSPRYSRCIFLALSHQHLDNST